MDFILQLLTNHKVVNSIGLGFDIFGAVIIFKYGLPNQRGQDTWGGDVEIKKQDRRRSLFGISMLIVGFTLQIISNWL